mgnify:CR=1 FL=1
MEERDKKDMNRQPMAVYECHVGSFMKHPDGAEEGFYNYRQFADRIVEYLKEMKYTHVELMVKILVPQSGCSPRRGSGCSKMHCPSNCARPCASVAK